MGDTGFRVHPDALERYSSLLAEQSEQLERIQSIVAGISISADAFGHLPNAQNLAETYRQHADAGRENIGILGEAVRGTSDGLSGVARSYAEQEDAISAGMGGGQ